MGCARSMAWPPGAPRSLREIFAEDVARIGGWITSQLVTHMVSPTLGLATSIAFISLFALRRIGIAIRNRGREGFLEYVRSEIESLQIEIDRIKEHISRLRQAYKDVKEEDKKISFEKQLEAEESRLRELVNIRLYFESLLSAIRVIEPLRHVHGDKVDKVYDRIIELSIRASEGRIGEKDLNDVIDRIGRLVDSVPDFPYILLEVARERLK